MFFTDVQAAYPPRFEAELVWMIRGTIKQDRLCVPFAHNLKFKPNINIVVSFTCTYVEELGNEPYFVE